MRHVGTIVALALLGACATEAAGQTVSVYIDQAGGGDSGTRWLARPLKAKGGLEGLTPQVLQNGLPGERVVPIDELGPGPKASLSAGNRSAIVQEGSGNAASVDVRGRFNVTSQAQSGAQNASALAIQGSGNTTTVTQQGRGNAFTGAPTGTAQGAWLGIYGDANRIDAAQYGNANRLTAGVIGSNKDVSYTQIGNDLSGKIQVIGAGKGISAVQVQTGR